MGRAKETREEIIKKHHSTSPSTSEKSSLRSRLKDKCMFHRHQNDPPSNAHATDQQYLEAPPTGQAPGIGSLRSEGPRDIKPVYSLAPGVLEETNAKIRNAQQEVKLIECGFRNTVPPSEAEKQKMRREFGFSSDTTYIAVAGIAGTGTKKFVETISLCPPKGSEKIEWRGIPEAGPPGTPCIDYFHNQGLYAYNAIIILMTERVADIDCGIASMSHRCGIPFIFIRLGSNHLLNLDEVPINERAEMMTKMRAEIFSHLRTTLVEGMQIPDQNFLFFLINMRALKSRIQGRPNKPDIVECDEAALLDYLGKRFHLQNPSTPQKLACDDGGTLRDQQWNEEQPTPKDNLTPPPNVTGYQQQSVMLSSHSTVESPRIVFIGASGLCEELVKASGDVGDKWSSLRNVQWEQAPPIKGGQAMKFEQQTFAQYLESLSLSLLRAVIILVGPWINYPEICLASECEAKGISYIFLRVDHKCCSSCQGCAAGLNSPLQHPLEFDRADDWTKSFVPKAVPELRKPGPVFWVERSALIDEIRGRNSGSGQAAKLLTYIKDLVEKKSATSARPSYNEGHYPPRQHDQGGPYPRERLHLRHQSGHFSRA